MIFSCNSSLKLVCLPHLIVANVDEMNGRVGLKIQKEREIPYAGSVHLKAVSSTKVDSAAVECGKQTNFRLLLHLIFLMLDFQIVFLYLFMWPEHITHSYNNNKRHCN